MLTTPHKRFVWARSEERFADFSDFSFFRSLLIRRRAARRSVKERPIERRIGRWKPAAWTPWLWVK